MDLFEEKELTIEEIVGELKISKCSYDKIKELNMIDDLILIFRKDNDINICQSDLRYVFCDKEIIGNISSLLVKIEDNKEAKTIVIFIQDEKYDEEIVKSIIDKINVKQVDCLIGFKKSINKRICGFITG